MKIPSKKYDFVIIGSGLGGLLCSYILADAGFNVIVLEKNTAIGGCLQVFVRDKCILDTGVHYIGSLDEGENLNQFFNYFGLLKNIDLRRMDDDGFDVIRFSDGREYRYGQGYIKFKENLVKDFPAEENAINSFCDKMQEICKYFPLYNLETEIALDYFLSNDIRELNAFDFIASLTQNKRLQNVLAGSNPLYAGIKEKTPFYVHALILNSYICGSYKVIDGGGQISKYISNAVRKMGAEIYTRKKVVGANYDESGKISEVVLENGEIVAGTNFISNIHPAVTIDIFGENKFLSAYSKRIKSLENTISTFTMNITFHKNTFKYLNHNIYQYFVEDVWAGIDYKQETWPEGFFLCTPASSQSKEFADSISVMTYMNIEETKKWEKTFNTVGNPADRGEEYHAFKRKKEEKILKKLEELFPDIRSKIKNTYSSSPLTYRDYIGNYDGSLYGIIKDSNNPTRSFINTKTKIRNLYLTGQNLVFHGILGVTIGAFVTCFEFVNKKELIEKVKKAK